MKFTSRLTVVALACTAATAFAADPIKIGVDGPLTGGSSSMGVSMRDGVKLAADEINKAGGVLGRQILLVERDDEAKNELRRSGFAQELINKEKVVATVGFINTGVGVGFLERFYEEAKIPVIVNATWPRALRVTQQFLPPDYDKNFVFRNAANDTHAVVDDRRRGHARASVASRRSPFSPTRPTTGSSAAQDLEKALGLKYNVKPVADREVQYQATST